MLKLCNMQKQVETMSHKLKKLESEHEKALKTIQGFMERQQQLETVKMRKDQRIMELEIELSRLREHESTRGTVRDVGQSQLARRDFSSNMTDDPERDASNNQVEITIFRLCMPVSAFLRNHVLLKICGFGLKLGGVVSRVLHTFLAV